MDDGPTSEFTCHLCGKVKEGADERSALLKLAFHYDRRHKGWTQSPPFLATTDASVLRESLARMTLLWQEAEARIKRLRDYNDEIYAQLDCTANEYDRVKGMLDPESLWPLLLAADQDWFRGGHPLENRWLYIANHVLSALANRDT